MLRYSLAAITAAALIAVAIVIYYPIGAGPRQEPRILSSGDTAPPDGFVIHDAPAPTPAPAPPAIPAAPPQAAPAAPDAAAAAPPPGDLDAVMARLRAASQNPDAAATPATPSPSPAGTPPASTTPPGQQAGAPLADSTPAPAPATPPDAAAAPPLVTPSPPHWSSVTPQGTKWRMARSGSGYTLTIDLGGGQAADVHVQPAFAALDPRAVAMRVDYLRSTILQNFSGQSNSYTFARDGSVSVDR